VSLDLHFRIVGALQIVIAALHVTFPKRLGWKEELQRLSLLNRQIFVVHAIFVCVVLLLMGGLSLFAPDALLEPTRLGRFVLAGFTAFWALRLAFQWFVYDQRLWRGSAPNTLIHLVATALWVYFTVVYGFGWLGTMT
jgi:hypothetical protein